MITEDRTKKLLSTVIVLATGFVLGFFIWNTWFHHVPHHYFLDFKQGQWIAAPEDRAQGYFRKELHIPTGIRHAWIVVAATDSFALYVNEKVVDSKGYASVNVSGIYDIGPYLLQGKNVLGIVVRRVSYPGPAMAVVEGAYMDEIGREHPFYSDDSWKSSAIEQRQGSGEILWYSESFDAALWSQARSAGYPNSSNIYPLDTHSFAIAMPPQGKWIESTASLQGAAFSYMLTLPANAEDAWIRIAAAKPYFMTINGVNLDATVQTNPMAMKLPDVRIQKNDDEVSTDIFNITSLLHAGANNIVISSGLQAPSFRGLFVDGFVVINGEKIVFGTDSTWAINSSHAIADAHSFEASRINVVADNALKLPLKRVMNKTLPVSYFLSQIIRLILILLLTEALIYLLWKGTSRILFLFWNESTVAAEVSVAFVYLPVFLFLLYLVLLSFDIRFDPALPFQGRVIVLSIFILLIFKVVLIFEAWFRKKQNIQITGYPIIKPYLSQNILYPFLMLSLLAGGAYLRLNGLDTQSLYHDEISMVNYTQGFLNKGYPYKMIGPVERPLATYELIPYPIALSIKLFGFNDFTLRLPAALFGTVMILLIYFVGKQFFDRRVGLLAAAIYTFCPQALLWAKYLWHPQQVQFFALLTSYFFYRAINQNPFSLYYLYISAGMFIVTYLSWEGVGFLLPAFVLSIFAVKRKDLSWLKDKHAWIAGGIVFIAVALQLTRRLLQQYPYIVVGSGLSDTSLPTLYFLNPMYDPLYYIKNFLWLDNNAILTILVLIGMPFILKQKEFSYYLTILFSILFMMTNLLSNAAIRYVYYLEPFLVLLAAVSVFFILDNITRFVRDSGSIVIRMSKWGVIIASCALVIVGGSFFLKLYRLNNFSFPRGSYTRQDSYYIDYRGPAQYMKSHYQSGDLVISVMPDALRHYSNINSQYFIENYAIRQVLYDPTESTPHYLERMVGVPVVRSLDELNGVINRSRRAWIVAVPYSIFSILVGAEIKGYIDRNGKVVYESYNGRIYLLER